MHTFIAKAPSIKWEKDRQITDIFSRVGVCGTGVTLTSKFTVTVPYVPLSLMSVNGT